MHATPEVGVRDGGGHGGITGRDAFQRLKGHAAAMSGKVIDIDLGKA